MTIAWFLPLIFYAILTSVAGKDLGPIIRIAQCRSTCLQNHEITDCGNKDDICQQCWYSCNAFETLGKKGRRSVCEKHNFQDLASLPEVLPVKPLDKPSNLLDYLLPRPCVGCETACTFFQTKGAEVETYDASKLPAAENSERGEIQMNRYDVAVVMHKDKFGIWVESDYYSAKQQPTLAPLGWIIVVNEKGEIKHYSWEKWWPELNKFVSSSSFDEAYISWYDWRDQLKLQRDIRLINLEPSELELLNNNDKLSKPSFVVTWQRESGYGITGNQVTNSESAQISLSRGNRYVVRIASSDGPGSCPITIQAQHWTEMEITFLNIKFTFIEFMLTFLLTNLILILLLLLIACIFGKQMDHLTAQGHKISVNGPLAIENCRLTIKPVSASGMEAQNNLIKELKGRNNSIIIEIFDDSTNLDDADDDKRQNKGLYLAFHRNKVTLDANANANVK